MRCDMSYKERGKETGSRGGVGVIKCCFPGQGKAPKIFITPTFHFTVVAPLRIRRGIFAPNSASWRRDVAVSLVPQRWPRFHTTWLRPQSTRTYTDWCIDGKCMSQLQNSTAYSMRDNGAFLPP